MHGIFSFIFGFDFVLLTVEIMWNETSTCLELAVGILVVDGCKKCFSFWAPQLYGCRCCFCRVFVYHSLDWWCDVAFMMDIFWLCVCTRWFSPAALSFLALQSILLFDCNCILRVCVFVLLFLCTMVLRPKFLVCNTFFHFDAFR